MTDALSALHAIASEVGAAEIAADVHTLGARVAEGLYYVACVGQFKRGKSTLLNALAGMPLLPTGVVPVTAVITIVRYGDPVRALVRFVDGREESVDPASVAEYVTEKQNPENRKGVRAVEIFAPSDVLASGMCFVDTPGLGSVFQQNTETTRAFLPHIDAALVVLGADPPISGEEAIVAEEISREVRHIIFVLNKADRSSGSDVAEAATFTRHALQQRLGREVRLLTVSAIEKMRGARTRDWPALEAELTTLARDAGADLVRAAQERGQRRLAARLEREIALQREALLRPIADSEARVADLKRTIDDARRALGDLAYLFTAEQDRLSRQFDDERIRFLENALNRASRELNETMARCGSSGAALREEVFQAAESIASRVVRQWLGDIEPRAEELYSAAMKRLVGLGQDFLQRVNAADEIGIEQRFRTRRGFYFTGLWTLTSRPPGAFVVDIFRSAARQRKRAGRDAHAYLQRLFESNSARVANDLRERVLESRRVLEAQIRSALDRATKSGERALDRARASQEAGASAVERDIRRLDEARVRLRELTVSPAGSLPLPT